MDLHKLKTEEIRGFDAGKLRETEHEVRRAMVNIRMDIYTSRNAQTAKIRGLRQSLARILTVKNATKAVAPQAAKAASAPKTASAVAAKPAKAAKPSTAKAKASAKTKTATKK